MSYLTPNSELKGIRDSLKATVRVATTGNINLGSTLTTIDMVSLVDKDRVLIKDQSTPSQNGIYVWSSITSMLSRARDALELFDGLLVTVTEGLVHADTAWNLITNNPITVGVTGLEFVKQGGGTIVPLVVANNESVDGVVSTLALGAFAFNPAEYGGSSTFEFEVVLSASTGTLTATALLYNLTDAEDVTGATLTTSSTTPVKQNSGSLTVGTAAGNLKSTEKIYEVQIMNSGTLNTDQTYLGIAVLRVLG